MTVAEPRRGQEQQRTRAVHDRRERMAAQVTRDSVRRRELPDRVQSHTGGKRDVLGWQGQDGQQMKVAGQQLCQHTASLRQCCYTTCWETQAGTGRQQSGTQMLSCSEKIKIL